jgi:hypothetical protein
LELEISPEPSEAERAAIEAALAAEAEEQAERAAEPLVEDDEHLQ